MSLGALPPEILKLVFKNLEREEICSSSINAKPIKVDLKTCLSVCKSWQCVAQEFFRVKISLNEDSLPHLLEDISYFGDRVESISVCQSSISSERERYSLIWRDILLLCPNLISVSFAFIDIYHYLHVMVYGGVEMKCFQLLDIIKLPECSLVTRKLYLELNIKHHATITELVIVRLDDIPTYEVFDDFIKFITQFPRLTVLNLIGATEEPTDSNIDIHKLFESVPHLKEFNMREFKKVSIDSLENKEDISKYYSRDLNILSMRIYIKEMDTKTLEYITARSKKVGHLVLDIKKLIANESHSSTFFYSRGNNYFIINEYEPDDYHDLFFPYDDYEITSTA